MNRRKFVKSGAIAASAPVTLSLFGPQIAHGFGIHKPGDEKPDWLMRLINLNDQQIKDMISSRIADKSHPDFGGFANGYDIVNEQGTAIFVKMALCALTTPESAFYHDATLTRQVNEALLWLLKVQHPDGTVNLYSTNFNSPPDTGFIVKWLGPPAELLIESSLPGKDEVLNNLKQFMQKAGNAMLYGGIHTPNHRWVVSAALAWLNMLWPDPRYKERAEEWLAEGIDMDIDGQYHEKSTYIYTPLTNRTLITIARGFDKPELLDFVGKNLEMSMYYVHPNGEVATEASGRQDKAQVGTMESYYFPYRYMAIHDNNGQFAAMCRLIEKTAFDKVLQSSLHNILEDKALWRELPEEKPIPIDYERAFKNSGLVRIRRGNYDASLISRNPVFFTFSKGNAVLQGIRVASAFFGKGQFTSDEIINENNGWKLSRDLEGPYYQPLPPELRTGDNDWVKTPRGRREMSEVQKLEANVGIKEIDGGFELDINIQGTDRVPVTVELIFRQGGTFSGVEKLEMLSDAWLLKGSSASYTVGGDVISFGPGTHAHKWAQLRGALPKMDAPTVYLTGFTPFHHTIQFS